MRLQRSPRHRLLVSAALVVSLLGCKVTADDIDYWKGTVKGPGKIVAVMVSEGYPIELRSKAALALVEMERQDVNGVSELQQALMRLDESTRREVIDRMVPGLVAMMRGGETAQGESSDAEGPPAVQVRAKDAAYLMTALASPQARPQLIEAVVGWYVVDFNGRSLAGNYSAEQVIRSLGGPAAAMLVDALNPHMPQPALVKIAELIGQLGTADTKRRAAERLVDIERQMESAQFVDWLKEKIVAAIRAQQPDARIDPNRVTAAASLNRESFINDGALPAMKFMASQPVVVNRLIEIAQTAGTDEATTERRKRALQALEGNVNESHLDAFLAMALDGNNPIAVRDYAFDRVGDIRSARAIPPMWPLVQNATDQRLRWRAGEMVLAIGGPEVVQEFFDKLPSGENVEYAPEELEGYATRMSQMNPPPTDRVRAQFQSPDWFDRVIALRYFERRGTAADVAQMQRFTGDGAAVKGPRWAEGFTVGKVAEEAIANMQQRLSGGGQQPAGGGAAGQPSQ